MDTAALFLAGAGTGLLAGATTCAAVQLGLLTGAVRSTPGRIGPIAAFLTSKLAAHAVLGAALGLLGGVLQPGPRIRGALLVAAALVLVLFALDLLGVSPARRLTPERRRPADTPPDGATGTMPGGTTGTLPGGALCTPPTEGTAVPGKGAGAAGHCVPPGRRARLRGPVALGAATVLVPCGLTLTAELLAVSSRSAPAGAAVMAGFVLGTAPMFGLIGLTLGRVMAVLRGRLTALPAVVLLAVAGWTALSGLRLGGWLPQSGGTAPAADAAPFVSTDVAGRQIVTVWALDQGYRPARVTARAGVPTVLVLRTQDTRGHTRAFTLPARDLDVVLPVDGETRLDLGRPGPGRMRFVCASGHYPGAITFR
ncbi:sulfite exporter TauE/SafE family protein [Spirillospora sp. NPDC047279]|uniref:urease accessory protein UreH domain-containing protein n=1 Tax=Spirillospora sp. NPDC047279 TaxID=3155478 RepID=UPI00340BDED0